MRKDYFDQETKIRVAIYARVSTEHEAQISALENQIQYYDNILKDHPNWILYERYVDKGITGTSILKRDAFVRMLKDANADKFDLIITREVSRFARNTADTLVQVRLLVNNQIGVYFTEDNIFASLYSEDEWELKLSLMATLAQNESKKISSRVKAGQKISFEKGVFYGNGNILGYDRVGKNMVVNKEQADTVQRIFDLYTKEKVGLRSMQFILEQEGRRTAMGKTRWSAQVIGRILKNKFYCGLIEYRKEFVPDYLMQKKIRNNGEVDKVIVKGTHEPIISEDQFYEAQEILQSKVRKVNGKTVGHVISEDIYCRKLICQCGHTFNKRKGYETKRHEQRYLYQCYDQIHNGTVKTRMNKGLDISDCCTSITIPNWKLDITADWLFRRFFDNKQLIYDRVMDMLEDALNVSSSIQSVNEDIAKCQNSITAMNDKFSAVVDLYVEGHIPKDIYLAKTKQMEDTIEKYKCQLSALEDKLEQVQNENNVLDRKRAIADFLAIKPFTEARAIPKELIDDYVDSIRVDSEKMTWVLRVPDGCNFDNELHIKDGKKKSGGLTPYENYVRCEAQHRQQLLQNSERLFEYMSVKG